MDKVISGCGGSGGGGDGGGGGGSWPYSSRVREIGPPAFLTKTFIIVDDPNTNSIISWGEFRNTFVIWDHLKFSAEIIPKYFRHSNFSSFVYQLNNYGFRKVGGDHQWEYKNPDFQQGKVHLLANIKRRGQNPEYIPRRSAKRTLSEILRNEMNESKLEIEKLKREQAEMQFHVMALEEEVKNAENKTKKLIVYWAKAFDEIIAHKMSEENNDDDEATKKRKLDINPENNGTDEEYVDGKNNQDEEEEMVKEDIIPSSDQNQAVSSSNDNGSLDDHHEANANSEAIPEKNSDDYTFWKTILLDDDDDEGEKGAEMANKQAKIALDLEHLIIKLEDRDNEWVTTTL